MIKMMTNVPDLWTLLTPDGDHRLQGGTPGAGQGDGRAWGGLAGWVSGCCLQGPGPQSLVLAATWGKNRKTDLFYIISSQFVTR